MSCHFMTQGSQCGVLWNSYENCNKSLEDAEVESNELHLLALL